MDLRQIIVLKSLKYLEVIVPDYSVERYGAFEKARFKLLTGVLIELAQYRVSWKFCNARLA